MAQDPSLNGICRDGSKNKINYFSAVEVYLETNISEDFWEQITLGCIDYVSGAGATKTFYNCKYSKWWNLSTMIFYNAGSRSPILFVARWVL